MPQSHIVSIHDIRANVAVTMRGFFFLVLLPGGFVILLLMQVVRDLPDVDLSPLRSSELWLLVALTAGGRFTAVRGTERMTAPYLWTLVIADAGLILAGTTFLVRTATNVDFAEPVPSLVGDIATLVIPVALLATWVLVLPARAALRLLSTRMPPDGTPLPQVLAPPRSQEDAAAVDRRWNPAAVTYRVAAVLAGIVAAVFVLSLLATQHVVQMILSLGLETIVDRNAWPRLVFVMPPSGPEDTAARWANICAALQNTPWRNGLDSLDPHQVVAMRLLDAGALCVVTSDRRRLVDFAVAMRIMLHQLRSVVPA